MSNYKVEINKLQESFINGLEPFDVNSELQRKINSSFKQIESTTSIGGSK
jgi:hypothetical protein